MKKLAVLLAIAIVSIMMAGCVSSGSSALPAGQTVFEDFEGAHYWIAVGTSWKDGDNSIQAKTSDKNATSGKKSLECMFKFLANAKGAAFYAEGFDNTDWSITKKFILDVTNPTSEELTIGFAVCTGSDWNWMELGPAPLKAGLNKDIVIDLTAKAYSSGATSWQPTGTLSKMNDVKRVVLKFNGPVDFEGSVFVDNIRLSEN